MAHGKKSMTIRRAAFINMGARYAAAFVQLVYSIILARLLTPDEFGIVAIAQVFVVFFGLFTDMGLGAAVVQRQDLLDIDVSRLFGFSAVLAAVLGALFAAIGFPMSLVYGRDELLVVCGLLSFSVLLSTLNTIPNALLMKQERFLAVGLRQVVAALAASGIGLACAMAGAGYLAIVAYSLANSLFVFLWNYLTNCIRPAFRGIVESVRKVFSYSVWLFGGNLVRYFSRNADSLISGYVFGAADLGNYNKAYQLTRLPQLYLTGAVTSVMHPILAKRQDDVEYIYSVFVKTVKILSLFGVFFSVLFLFCAEEVIFVLYGDQWWVAVPCFRLLSLSVWTQMVCGTAGAMFQVLNKTRLQFIRLLVVAAVVVGGAVIGAVSGSIEAMALCEGVAYNVAFVTLCPFLVRMSFKKSIRRFLRVLLPDAAIFVMLCVVAFVLGLVGFPNEYAAFAVKLIVLGAVWVLLVLAFRQFKWLAFILPSSFREKAPSWMMR